MGDRMHARSADLTELGPLEVRQSGPRVAARPEIGSHQSGRLSITPTAALWNAFEGVIAAILLIALAPVIAVLAACLALDGCGPAIIWRGRTSAGGKAYRLYTFRTMRASLDKQGQRLTDSQRASRVGDLIKRCGAERLPTLFNVVRGDVSLLGSRR